MTDIDARARAYAEKLYCQGSYDGVNLQSTISHAYTRGARAEIELERKRILEAMERIKQPIASAGTSCVWVAQTEKLKKIIEGEK